MILAKQAQQSWAAGRAPTLAEHMLEVPFIHPAALSLTHSFISGTVIEFVCAPGMQKGKELPLPERAQSRVGRQAGKCYGAGDRGLSGVAWRARGLLDRQIAQQGP